MRANLCQKRCVQYRAVGIQRGEAGRHLLQKLSLIAGLQIRAIAGGCFPVLAQRPMHAHLIAAVGCAEEVYQFIFCAGGQREDRIAVGQLGIESLRDIVRDAAGNVCTGEKFRFER